jgi:hypothetical protein
MMRGCKWYSQEHNKTKARFQKYKKSSSKNKIQMKVTKSMGLKPAKNIKCQLR